MTRICLSKEMEIKYWEKSISINDIEIHTLNDMTPKEYAEYEMRNYYNNLLQQNYENLVVLTGSGTSAGVGYDNRGMTMKDLWLRVYEALGYAYFKEFCENVKFNGFNEAYTDLEELLYRANQVKDFIEDKNLQERIDQIQDLIIDHCKIILPNLSVHEDFLEKLTNRDLFSPRVKMFTLNYDTLFEQAASKGSYVIIDGFSYSFPRTFNGKYYDLDVVVRRNGNLENGTSFEKRVFHLYKIHGSINWERDYDNVIQSENTTNPVMIYPKNSDYEASFDHPFFEMMSRFQQVLRKPDTLLIVVGFSFGDRHIASMIREALESNPDLKLMVVSLDIEDNPKIDFLKKHTQHHKNVVLLNESFKNFVDNYPFL